MDSTIAIHEIPAPQFLRTGHSDKDTSIFISDNEVPLFRPFGPQSSGFAIFDRRDTIPVKNRDHAPLFSNTLPRCPPSGLIFASTDIVPGGESPMHRTESLDYAVVMSGEIVLALDGGEEKAIKEGTVIVQQGVNHKWINRTQRTCRIAFVMIGAEKLVTAEGEALEETVFKK